MISIYFIYAISSFFEYSYQQMPDGNYELKEIPMTFAPTTKFISVQGDIENNSNISLTIDISCNLTWINKSDLIGFQDLEGTERRSYSQKITKDISVNGYYYNGFFSLSPTINLKNYNYLLADSIKLPTKFKSVLGLARRFDNERDNFVMELYKQQKILSAVFSLVVNGKNQMLQIGTLIDGIYEYPEFAVYVPFLDIDDKWRISLKGVFFGDLGNDFIPRVDSCRNQYRIAQTLYEVNSNIQLSSTDKNIIVPLAFLKYIEKYYFKGRYCKIRTIKNISAFQCDTEYENQLDGMEDIHFVVDNNIALRFKASELYTKSKTGEMFFAVMSFDKQDMWIFGYYFLKKFHLTFCYKLNQLIIFSLDNKAIVLLDNTPRFNIKETIGATKIKICLIIQIVLLSIGLSMLFIHFRKHLS